MTRGLRSDLHSDGVETLIIAFCVAADEGL
jgi:hypothetical protein